MLSNADLKKLTISPVPASDGSDGSSAAQPVSQPETAASASPVLNPDGKPMKLWLSLPDESAISFIRPLLGSHSGGTDVMLYVQNTKKILKAPASLRVQPDKVLLDALADLLGQKNVILKA